LKQVSIMHARALANKCIGIIWERILCHYYCNNTHTHVHHRVCLTPILTRETRPMKERKKNKRKKILTSTRTRNNYDASSTFVYLSLSRVYLRSICRASCVYRRFWHRKR
jgi:hypothetical protein